MLSSTLTLTLRQRFLADFATHTTGLTYALLKAPAGPLTTLSPGSDLDLVIQRTELPDWERRLTQLPGLARASFCRLGHGTYVQLFFEDHSYLELDLLHTLRRRHLVFLDAGALLQRRQRGHLGISVADPVDSYAYVWLFFGLNGAAVPDTYRQWRQNQPSAVQAAIRSELAARFGLPEDRAWIDYPETVLARVLPVLKAMPQNRGLAGWKQRLSALRSHWQKAEPVITFSGVDGAGKSTLLAAFQEMLTKKYRRRVVVIRHRPSMLPILSAWRYGKAEAEAKARHTLPRQGSNRNGLSSWLRFGYYYLDYLIGQWIVHFRYSRRGVVVLYDRYYFDFIVDGRRSNLAVSPAIVRALYALIRAPRLNFLLYAKPSRILARKQELDADTIRELTLNYKALFAQLQSRRGPATYLAIDNHVLEETLAAMEEAFIEIA